MSDSGFSQEQQQTLASVLDQIIPPSEDGRLPGAGAAGLAGYIDRALEQMPDLRPMIVASLKALGDLALRRHSRRYAELGEADKAALAAELAASADAFPPALVLHAFAGYYQTPRVLEALGLEPRPPHPSGYTMQPNDLTLLDEVRRRPKMYRE
jgi:hypothetical protein